MKSLKQRAFTIIELLIVMALLALIAGVVGINIQSLLQEQRYKTSSQTLLEQLQTAQQLMLILDQDILVSFVPTDSGLRLQFTFDQNIDPALIESVNKKRNYQGIQTISFEDTAGRVFTPPFRLEFSAVQDRIPVGKLLMSAYPNLADRGPLMHSILMEGEIHPLELSPYDQSLTPSMVTVEQNDALYPAQAREQKLQRQDEKALPSP